MFFLGAPVSCGQVAERWFSLGEKLSFVVLPARYERIPFNKGASVRMKRPLFAFCLALMATVSLAAAPVRKGQELTEINARASKGKLVIANRASGTISVIDAASDRVTGTYPLPAGAKMPEPMYVVYAHDRVFVGDRANNRVAVFHPRTFAVETTVPAGAGIWHMWADPFDQQLWVNNDIDKTCTVIDPRTLTVRATVPTPADLAAAGGKPHDVILDPFDGQFAYVTLIGVAGAFDYVVKFSTTTFTEVARAAVGKDPHISATAHNDLLYVPCQNSNVVQVLRRDTLAPVTTLAIPGAHGAGMAADGHTFYTTNFTGGGTAGLWAINTATNSIISEAVDTPFAVPHNLALTPGWNNRKLYVTHSGATASQVTVYKLKGRIPVFHKTIAVGFNPFGLAYVP
jgi:DNA-binding beta-propeller fold protein YncE